MQIQTSVVWSLKKNVSFMQPPHPHTTCKELRSQSGSGCFYPLWLLLVSFFSCTDSATDSSLLIFEASTALQLSELLLSLSASISRHIPGIHASFPWQREKKRGHCPQGNTDLAQSQFVCLWVWLHKTFYKSECDFVNCWWRSAAPYHMIPKPAA